MRLIVSVLCLSIAAGALADDRVKKLPPEFRKWLEEDVVYIITDKEKELFLPVNMDIEEEGEDFLTMVFGFEKNKR